MFSVKTKIKLVVARVKVVGFRLFLVSLGVVIGASGVYVTYAVEANVYQPADTYTGVLVYNALPTY